MSGGENGQLPKGIGTVTSLIKNKESDMQEQKSLKPVNNNLVESKESPIEVLQPPASRLNGEISQSMNLCNSVMSDLHSQMKEEMTKKVEQFESNQFKLQNLSFGGRAIADLMKQKIELMKLATERQRRKLD